MSQDLVSYHLDDTQWAAADAAIAALAEALGPMLVSLTPTERRKLVKMGDASEPFSRRSLDVMSQNVGLLPRNLDVTEMRRDLQAHDALNARMARLTQLLEKMRDTEMALGSDVMALALEGYAILKVNGKGEGLDGLKRVLKRRFDSNGVTATPAPAPTPTPTPAPTPTPTPFATPTAAGGIG